VASGNSAHAVLWHERDADADVLGNADLALYRAKAGGRNTFCFFNADIERATLARHRLERELPVAPPRQGTRREPSRSQLILTLARRRAAKCRPLRPRLPTALALPISLGDFGTSWWQFATA
jgi:hypothetical protein